MNLLQDKKPVVWTISGSDSGGGAGVQADLHTFHDFSVHGCSVITALTAQNSFAMGYTVATERKNVVAQINALDSDMPAKAIKVGMLLNGEIIESVCKYLNDYNGLVVCDPVVTSANGGSLLEDDAGQLIREKLLPRVDLLTPNAREAQSITGVTINSPEDMMAAAQEILELGVRSVVVTGGHFEEYSDLLFDYWTDGEQSYWLMGEYINTINDHGSGCSFSSAITAALAQGYSADDAMVLAKAYVTQGLRYAQQIGSGPGPVGHFGWPSNLDDLPALVEQLPEQNIGFEACELSLYCYPRATSLHELASIVTQPDLDLVRLQLPEEQALAVEMLRQAKALAAEHQIHLVIEGSYQLAIDEYVYGVHVELSDLDSAALLAVSKAGLRLGVTVNSYADIAKADALEVSYIEVALDNCESKSVEQLEEWVELLSDYYPVIASRVEPADAESVRATGVDGLLVSADS